MLVGHGTRDAAGTDEFFSLGEQLADRSPIPVRWSLLEFQQPTISEAWRSLIDLGVTHVHVAPLLLFAAGHAKSDIPDEIAKASAATPGVTFDQCRPLSRAPAMIDLVVQRINETLTESDCDPDETAIVMVGRGSHDPCARSDMRVLTEVVANRIAVAEFQTAFYAMTTPTVPETLDGVVSSGQFKTVIVHRPPEAFAQRYQAAAQPGAHRVERNVEAGGEVGVGLALEVGPAHGLGAVVGQLLHAVNDSAGLAHRHAARLGAGRRIAEHVVLRHLGTSGSGTSRAEPVDAVVPGHRRHPGDGAEPIGPVAMGVVPDLHVHLLKGIFRLCPVSQHTQALAEEFRGRGFVETPECRTVPRRGTGEVAFQPFERLVHDSRTPSASTV